MSTRKIYLGDAVYADFNPEQSYTDLILTTEDGYRATNTIILEPEVWRMLKEYMDTSMTNATSGEDNE